MITAIIHNSQFRIMITIFIHNPLLIHNSKLFERSSHQYVIIMITDVVTVQSSRVKTQIIKFKAQSSKFKVQRINGFEKFVVVESSMIKSKFVFVL